MEKGGLLHRKETEWLGQRCVNSTETESHHAASRNKKQVKASFECATALKKYVFTSCIAVKL